MDRTVDVEIDDCGRWNGRYTVLYQDNLARAKMAGRLQKKYRRLNDLEASVMIARDMFAQKVVDWELPHQPGFECNTANKHAMFSNAAGGPLAARIIAEADEKFADEDMAIEKN